jgi:hypothetical protein
VKRKQSRYPVRRRTDRCSIHPPATLEILR